MLTLIWGGVSWGKTIFHDLDKIEYWESSIKNVGSIVRYDGNVLYSVSETPEQITQLCKNALQGSPW